MVNKELNPITVNRVLSLDEDGLFTYFRILNGEPGEDMFSLTYEDAYGNYWCKIVNSSVLNGYLKNKI